MALTKVSGGILDPGINVAGIVTAIGFDGPFIGGIGDHIIAGIVTATGLDINGNADVSGSLTVGSGGLDLNGSGDISGDLVIHGNLTANGDFTTLNTTLREVEILRVDANSSEPAGIITQTGAGDLLRLYDGSSQVVTVDDTGNIGVGINSPSTKLQVHGGLIKISGHAYARVTVNDGANEAFFGFENQGPLLIGNANADAQIRVQGTNDIFFQTGNTVKRLSIKGDTGNVGIGSEIPSAKLDVNGTSKFQDNVSFTTANGNGIIISKSSNYMMFGNSVTQYFGGSSMWLMHNGSTGYLHNVTGSLYIRNESAGDIYIQGKSGENSIICNDDGAVQLYHDDSLRLATTAQGINVSRVGGISQIGISQTTTTAYSVNGTISFINSSNTTSQIQGRTGAASTTGDILFLCNTVGDESLAILEDGKVRVPDRGRFVVGTDNDLNLYHDSGGSGSHIQNDNGTNLTVRTTGTYLYMHGNNIHLRSQTGNETMLTAVVNSAVSLYYDASTYSTAKLQTTATGVQIDTILKLNGAAGNPGKLQLQEGGALSEIRVERSTDTSSALLFGTEISGTTATRWKIDTAGHFIPSAAATYDIGSATAEIGHIYVADSKTIWVGSDQDLRIAHDPTHTVSYIQNTGPFQIQTDDLKLYNYSTADLYLRAQTNSSVDLYYDFTTHATPKLKTSATGIEVHGEVAASQDYPNTRPTLDLNFAAEKKLDPRITYRRTGSASFTDEFGKVVSVGGNVPRFDHDPVTRECKGLLIEESRTNYVRVSTNMASEWVSGSGSFGVDNAITNPDGSVGAYYHTGGELYHQDIDLSAASTNVIIVSLWVKERSGQSGNLDIEIFQQISGSVISMGAFSFNPATAVLGTSGARYSDGKVVEYPNGWYRVSVKATTASGDFSSTVRYDMQNEEHYVWGMQVEVGAFPTSFIPTNGSIATRGKDLAEIDGEEFTEFFNQTEGTINCAYWLGDDNSGMRVFQINDSNNSVIDIVAGSGSGSGGYAYVNTGGVAQANGGQSSTNANYLNKLHVTTLAYKANDIAGINRNTGVLTTDTSATLDGAYNQVTFYQHSNSGDQLNGHLQRVQYYPKRLPDNQLKNLNNQ